KSKQSEPENTVGIDFKLGIDLDDVDMRRGNIVDHVDCRRTQSGDSRVVILHGRKLDRVEVRQLRNEVVVEPLENNTHAWYTFNKLERSSAHNLQQWICA